jgi:hypothetical protein
VKVFIACGTNFSYNFKRRTAAYAVFKTELILQKMGVRGRSCFR